MFFIRRSKRVDMGFATSTQLWGYQGKSPAIGCLGYQGVRPRSTKDPMARMVNI